MKHYIKTWKTRSVLMLASCVLLFSCNKDLPEALPTPYVPPAGPTIMSIIDSAPQQFSLLKAALDRVGLNTALNDSTKVFTVFAPDDAAFAASGISLPVINGLPLATLISILNYHLIGGIRVTASTISEKFPNNQMQSMLMVVPPMAALPPGYRMPLSISRRGSAAWANQIPIKQVDVLASNGVVHVVAGLLAPPDSTLVQIVANDPSYSYLLAAITRADSGVAAPNRLVDALGNPLGNFTVMAPTNLAFQLTLTFVITQALVGQGMDPATALATATALASTPAVFSNPLLFGALNATTVRGIVAYHVIGRVSADPANSALVGRAFSVNMPSTATNVNTLVVPAPFVGPVPVSIQSTGGVVTVKGIGNPAAATVTTVNKHAVNGVIHRINGVLLPQ